MNVQKVSPANRISVWATCQPFKVVAMCSLWRRQHSTYDVFIVIWRKLLTKTICWYLDNIQIDIRIIEMTTINSVRWASGYSPTPTIQTTQATSWLKVWQQMLAKTCGLFNLEIRTCRGAPCRHWTGQTLSLALPYIHPKRALCSHHVRHRAD